MPKSGSDNGGKMQEKFVLNVSHAFSHIEQMRTYDWEKRISLTVNAAVIDKIKNYALP